MFEAVRKNKRIAQVILVLISLTFAFWGVDSYLNDRTNTSEVASVGDSKISGYQFEQAMREQQDRLRAANEGQVDADALNSPLFRRAVLENIVNQRLLALYAFENGLSVSDQQLRETIAGIESFQEGGQFSMSRYQAALRGQGMSELGFQERLRGELANQQILSAIGEAAVVPTSSARRFLAAQLEERTVHTVQLKPEDYVDQVSVTADDAKAYYDTNASDYEVPARVKARYVVLSPTNLRQGLKIAEAEARAEYEQTKQNFGVAEERKASHILVQVGADASEAEIAEARAKAEQLLAEIKAAPETFSDVARKSSDDPGSAQSGGDLGFFARGAMVKAFEDAVFEAGEGLLPEPVRSDFGFHIVRVDEIRPATIPSFEEVRARIEAELLDKAANRRFLEVAENFANIVYEQPDSLEPAAQAFDLEVKTTDDWIEAGAERLADFESPELVNALFSKDVLENKHNSDAIDVGNNTMVAVRVEAHEPARQRPFDEVKDEVEARLRTVKAAQLARADGVEKLEALRAGKGPALQWGEAITVQRGLGVLPPQAVAQVFSVPESPLPAYAGLELGDAGYALFRVDAVKHAEIAPDDERVAEIARQYGQLLGAQDLRAFLAELRDAYPVKVNAAAITPDESR